MSARELELEHVSLVVPRARMDAIVAALAAYVPGGDRARLAELLADAWADGRRRRATATTTLGAARVELRASIGESEALERAPEIVRSAMLGQALAHARRIPSLVASNAPELVVRNTRRQVDAAIAALDPSSPLPEEDEPRLFELDEEGTVFLHGWLEHVLDGSRLEGAAVTARIVRSLETIGSSSRSGRPMRPGIEHTAYATDPIPELWLPPDRGWLLDGGDVVVGEAGGPVVYSFDGDRARVAFLWRDGGAATSWAERV